MKVSATFSGTVNTASDFLTVVTAAASPRRFKLYDLIIGSDATAADNNFRWEIRKKTGAAATGTAVTLANLDVSDTIATTLVGTGNAGTNGAGTAVQMAVALNQRASFRFVSAPGGELVAPATASNGYSIFPQTGTAVACTVTFMMDEL